MTQPVGLAILVCRLASLLSSVLRSTQHPFTVPLRHMLALWGETHLMERFHVSRNQVEGKEHVMPHYHSSYEEEMKGIFKAKNEK